MRRLFYNIKNWVIHKIRLILLGEKRFSYDLKRFLNKGQIVLF